MGGPLGNLPAPPAVVQHRPEEPAPAPVTAAPARTAPPIARTVSPTNTGAAALREAEQPQGLLGRLRVPSTAAPAADPLADVAAAAQARRAPAPQQDNPIARSQRVNFHAARDTAVRLPAPTAQGAPGVIAAAYEDSYQSMAVGETSTGTRSGAIGVGISLNLTSLGGPIAGALTFAGVEAHLAAFANSSVSVTRRGENHFQMVIQSHAGTEHGGMAGVTALGSGVSGRVRAQEGGFERLVLNFSSARDAAAFRASLLPGASTSHTPRPGNAMGSGTFTIDHQQSAVGHAVRAHAEGDVLTGNGNWGIRKTNSQESTVAVQQSGGGRFVEWMSQSTTRSFRLVTNPFRSFAQAVGGFTRSASGTETLRPPTATVKFSLSKLDAMNDHSAEGIEAQTRTINKLTERLTAQIQTLNTASRYNGTVDVSRIRAGVTRVVNEALSRRDDLAARRDGAVTSFFAGLFKKQAITADFGFRQNPQTGEFRLELPRVTFEDDWQVGGSYTGHGAHVEARVGDTRNVPLSPAQA